MTIYRYELESLKQWANSDQHKPIILRGARQVGKTTLVEMLAKESGLQLVAINFERRPELAELFASNNPSQIIQLLALAIKSNIIPNKSLLFLDEVQTKANILIPALRYFYEDMPSLHVIAAGSLLDFSLSNANFPMPVGRIEYRYLAPLSFEEFLLAMKENNLLDFLKNYHLGDPFPTPIHDLFMTQLQKYFVIGGMPEAVATFAKNQDYLLTDRIKHSILNTYQDDFSKYGSPEILRKVFNRLPALIGNKLKYSHISHDVKSNVIASALEKLDLARVIYLVKHTAANGLPLGAEVNDKIFKPLFLDVGLMCASLGLNLLQISQLQDITFVNAGAIAEQFIGQHLLNINPSYQEPKLYYWIREKKSSSAEIDYIINLNTQIFPIEVKSGKAGSLRSLHYFLKEKSLKIGIRFNAHFPQLSNEVITFADGTIYQYQLLSLPLYFVSQLPRIATMLEATRNE